MAKVSVCIPSYRSHEPPNLASLAAELPAALDGLSAELVVALNGISAEAAGAPPTAQVVDLGTNKGVAIGWNRAAAAASGDILCFANDDVRLGRGSLRLLADALAAHPDAGVVGPVGTTWDLEEARHLDWIVTSSLAPGEVIECDVVSGFLFATRRSTFEAVGGFDEYYTPCSWEEVDFCTAVRARGLRCYAVAGVAHEHEFGISVGHKGWKRIHYDGRSESLWSIHRRNRRHFREKWAAGVASATRA